MRQERTVVRKGDNQNIRCDGMSIALHTAINTHNPCYACVYMVVE